MRPIDNNKAKLSYNFHPEIGLSNRVIESDTRNRLKQILGHTELKMTPFLFVLAHYNLAL